MALNVDDRLVRDLRFQLLNKDMEIKNLNTVIERFMAESQGLMTLESRITELEKENQQKIEEILRLLTENKILKRQVKNVTIVIENAAHQDSQFESLRQHLKQILNENLIKSELLLLQQEIMNDTDKSKQKSRYDEHMIQKQIEMSQLSQPVILQQIQQLDQSKNIQNPNQIQQIQIQPEKPQITTESKQTQTELSFICSTLPSTITDFSSVTKSKFAQIQQLAKQKNEINYLNIGTIIQQIAKADKHIQKHWAELKNKLSSEVFDDQENKNRMVSKNIMDDSFKILFNLQSQEKQLEFAQTIFNQVMLDCDNIIQKFNQVESKAAQTELTTFVQQRMNKSQKKLLTNNQIQDQISDFQNLNLNLESNFNLILKDINEKLVYYGIEQVPQAQQNMKDVISHLQLIKHKFWSFIKNNQQAIRQLQISEPTLSCFIEKQTNGFSKMQNVIINYDDDYYQQQQQNQVQTQKIYQLTHLMKHFEKVQIDRKVDKEIDEKFEEQKEKAKSVANVQRMAMRRKYGY